MRPLAHLGFGPNSPDYDLYKLDESLYDALHERTNSLIEKAYKNFMGDYYEEPKSTKKELNDNLDLLLNNKNKLSEMGAPKESIEKIDSEIVNVYNLIKSKQFQDPKDINYKNYCKNRNKLEKDWLMSNEYSSLISEIQQFNEIEYNKLKESLAKDEN